LAIRSNCETARDDCEYFLWRVFHHCRHLVQPPVSVGFAAEILCHREIPAVAGQDFQIVTGRMNGGGANVGYDADCVENAERLLFLQASRCRFHLHQGRSCHPTPVPKAEIKRTPYHQEINRPKNPRENEWRVIPNQMCLLSLSSFTV
jgi:hypothetical protein